MEMCIPIPERQKIFEEELQKRYDSEFFGLRLWKGHRDWWLEDQGIRREINSFHFLKVITLIIGSWQNKLCIDLGCGSGSTLIAIAHLDAKGIGLEMELAGFDLRLAKTRAWMYGLRPELINGDATLSPFNAGVFDIVISQSVVEHVKNVTDYLAEAYRILKPGGVLILTTDNRVSFKEGHTGLYFAHWLPWKLFRLFANLKRGLPNNANLSVWPRTYFFYLHAARMVGFRLLANRWDVFLCKSARKTKAWKIFLARFCQKTHFPLEAILPGTELILAKPY